MPVPDFSPQTIQTLAFRSGLICNNPHCSTITVGPSDAVDDLKLKLGEAAHIRDARKTTHRWEDSITDEQRAHISNGIWLCASCHTLIDKAGGYDFPADLLLEWKKDHEGVISSLLRTHRSPLAFLRQFTEEGSLAQEAVDTLEQHGALFVDQIYEVDLHVVESVERLRKELEALSRRVKLDPLLSRLLKDLAKEPREFMNRTSNFECNRQVALDAMRMQIGVLVRRLRDEFGCTVHGDLNRIVPVPRDRRF